MAELDELNIACRAYAHELTDRWEFTGWKPGQGNMRLHAQWMRADDYDGMRYLSQIQCFPLDGIASVIPLDSLLSEAKTRMREALEGIGLFTKVLPKPIPWNERRVM